MLARRNEKTFMEKAMEGEVLLDEIYDYIEEYHEGDYPGEIYDFLGMTKEEYFLWVKSDLNLKLIMYSRREKISIDQVVAADHKLAARGANHADIASIKNYLIEHGVISDETRRETGK